MKGRGRELIRVTLKQPGVSHPWELAPDGSHLAFAQNLGGKECRIQILPLSGGETREVVIQREIHDISLVWAADGRGFYIGSGDGALLFVDLDGRAEVLWKRETLWGFMPWGVPSRDGRHLAISAMTIESNVWMLENF